MSIISDNNISSELLGSGMSLKSTGMRRGWERVECRPGSVVPCQRSLHAAAVCGDSLYIFGGYDGNNQISSCFMTYIMFL